MKLVIIRHGEAGRAASDELRELTARGRAELGRLGKAMALGDLAGAEIWHSGYVRARQSAEILAGQLGLGQDLATHPELAPMGSPMDVMASIKGRDKDLILVGHQPFMGKMASCLLSGDESQKYVDFATGAAACFRPPVADQKHWRLLWLLDPALLG